MSNPSPSQTQNPLQVNPPDPQANLPTVASGGGGARLIKLQLPTERGDLLTNLSTGKEADEIALSRAMAKCDTTLQPYIGKVIRIAGVVMNMAEFESQEVRGEYTEKVYASIVLDDGTVIGTTGKAVMGQLAYLIGSKPSGSFNPPVEFEVRQHPSPPPKQPYYSIRRVGSTNLSKPKK